jgi:hypothetical protein
LTAPHHKYQKPANPPPRPAFTSKRYARNELDLRKSRLTQYSGKGTPRRKVKKVHRAAGTDDKKLQTALKKLNVQPIQAIEEVNMFKSDGNVIHFSAPKGTSFQSFVPCECRRVA